MAEEYKYFGKNEKYFNVQVLKAEIIKQTEYSSKISEITDRIVIDDVNTYLSFGSSASEDISKSSDAILKFVTSTSSYNLTDLLNELSDTMSKINLNELEYSYNMNNENKKGKLLDIIFGNDTNEIDDLVEKYTQIEEKIEHVYIKLKKVIIEMNLINEQIEHIFNENVESYKELIKYIIAGQKALNEIAEFENNVLLKKYSINRQNIDNAKAIIGKRVSDLKVTESVVLQTLPMIKNIEFTNYDLIEKINVSFIVTIPILKESITRIIMLKRKSLERKSLKALENRAKDVIESNLNNDEVLNKIYENICNSDEENFLSLKKNFETIINGIDETKEVEKSILKQKEEIAVKLKSINDAV